MAKKIKKKLIRVISEKAEKISKKVEKGIHKALKQKILKKPTAKIVGVSSEKTLSRFAQTTGPVVREVEQKEIVQDNRSQFFKEEFKKEEIGVNKWLS